ncbi:MAG: hypothetical protein NXH82_04930 [Rhodobacteraceae bacterium]|nr:hypothetical protein [Paracoccaceae bacterium]
MIVGRCYGLAMAQDSKRGRDLPRAPQFVKQKGLRDDLTDERNQQIALARKIEKLKKDLAKITTSRGYDTLLYAPSAIPDNLREKQRKVVLSALAHDIQVHPKLLAEYGLEAQPNPLANVEDDGKAPF